MGNTCVHKQETITRLVRVISDFTRDCPNESGNDAAATGDYPYTKGQRND